MAMVNLVCLVDTILSNNFKEQKPWETIEYDKDGGIVGKIVDGVQTIENSRQVPPKLEVDASA